MPSLSTPESSGSSLLDLSADHGAIRARASSLVLAHESVPLLVRTPLLVLINRRSNPDPCYSPSRFLLAPPLRPVLPASPSYHLQLSCLRRNPRRTDCISFCFFPLLLWRVSMVRGKSGCIPLSISICSGQSQSSSA